MRPDTEQRAAERSYRKHKMDQQESKDELVMKRSSVREQGESESVARLRHVARWEATVVDTAQKVLIRRAESSLIFLLVGKHFHAAFDERHPHGALHEHERCFARNLVCNRPDSAYDANVAIPLDSSLRDPVNQIRKLMDVLVLHWIVEERLQNVVQWSRRHINNSADQSNVDREHIKGEVMQEQNVLDRGAQCICRIRQYIRGKDNLKRRRRCMSALHIPRVKRGKGGKTDRQLAHSIRAGPG